MPSQVISSDLMLFQNIKSDLNKVNSSSHHHNLQHENIMMESGKQTKDNSGVEKSPGHICDIYCTECEIAAKKSRTRFLVTGGEVEIVNSSFARFTSSSDNWMNECNSLGNDGQLTKKSNFSVNLNVPSFDFRTHRLVINVSIENRKISDDSNRNLSQLKESGWYFEALNYQVIIKLSF